VFLPFACNCACRLHYIVFLYEMLFITQFFCFGFVFTKCMHILSDKELGADLLDDLSKCPFTD